uniref:Uncharacterized protein n=1 Tax=Noctiluca scintillans TaxID=2966 RepID=A0A7S1AMP3_NOCSC|mmetsp:Transcript_52685/g.140501  ORF Transcript_52685/g.140501 Transcript_52685/m.140501 type:complete len:252 (+) Transcript_52685:27-782(+)
MAFQRTLSRLQASAHWETIEVFAKDGERLEHTFPRTVASTAREDIRQICRYFDVNYRCVGTGTQKKITALKLDAIREKARAEELAASAPACVSAFYKAALQTLPKRDHTQVNGLFVRHWGGEHAWTLGDRSIAEQYEANTRDGAVVLEHIRSVLEVRHETEAGESGGCLTAASVAEHNRKRRRIADAADVAHDGPFLGNVGEAMKANEVDEVKEVKEVLGIKRGEVGDDVSSGSDIESDLQTIQSEDYPEW